MTGVKEASATANSEVGRFLEVHIPSWGPIRQLLWYRCRMAYRTDPSGRQWIDHDPLCEQKLAAASYEEPEALELLREFLGANVAAQSPMSPLMCKMAGLLLRDKFPVPNAKPGVRKSTRWERNHFIVLLVDKLVKEFSLAATQNEYRSLNSTRPPSAAKIVSDAFVQHGVHDVTQRAIREILGDGATRQEMSELDSALHWASSNPLPDNFLRRLVPENTEE